MAEDKVVDQTTEETEETTEETQEETTETSEGSDKKDDKPSEDLDEPSLAEAKNLYKLLKDPSTQKTVIEMLARNSGLLGAETKKEVKENVKDLKSLIKEGLGDKYAFMSEELTSVFEKVLETERQNVREEFNKLETQRIDQEVTQAFKDLARETKGDSERVRSKMIELMDEMPASPNISVKKYLTNLYRIASAGKAASQTQHEIADKIRRNSSDVAGRLRSVGPQGDRIPSNKKMSLDAAVQSAIKNVMKE